MAAQDAELQLKVSLDLAFFKQQLAGLGSSAAGYRLPVNIKFDRLSVQKELNTLGENIRRRTYRLNVETNLKAEIGNAEKLAKALADLEQASKKVGSVSRRMAPSGMAGAIIDEQTSYKQLQALYKFAKEASLPFEQLARGAASSVAELRRVLGAGFGEVGDDVKGGISTALKDATSTLAQLGKQMGETLLKATKGSLGIASPSREFKKIGQNVGEGFELGAVASMDKAFDALEQKLQERLRKLQAILSLSPSRRSAFPFVATGGRLESGPIAREIDQAYAQIAQIQERRQGRLATERGSLTQMAGRLLPPARDRSLPAARETIFPGGGALDQVTQGFVQSLKNTRDTLARNFSANTYLPKATRALATSMDVATKQLSGTKIAGLLPSKEMMEPLRFQRAQQRAAQIDAENAAKAQAKTALNQANLRGMFQGVPRINAPMIGAENAPLSRAAQYSLNKANRSLGLPMGPSSPLGSMGQFPMAGMIGRGSLGQFPMDTSLAIGGPSAMGQSVAGPTPWYNTSTGARGGFNPGVRSSAFFPMAGMMGPSSPLGRITPQSSMFGGGGAVPPSGGGGFGGSMGFGPDPSRIDLSVFQQSRVPLTGAIAELTSEFANAAKQVLLFGTAYKALAFFINLPNQAFEAAKALGTYKNQLQAVTSESNTFEQSFAFVDNLAQRFNVPLESARQGFVKLYASMEPAGFSQGQIENLFEGVSKATAAFGLSADKVDRVNYAFAQMASKGQIMSEELKGQLGDVLPGALALFAEAAQMSIPEFSKAMEDGALKGDAMTQVLDNVAILMNSKFGPAAQNASKTLQGALNEMQNNLSMMHESLAPFVNQFAATFGPQISSLIKDVTSAVNVLTGSFVNGGDALSTLSPRAEAIYKVFQQIGPSAVNAAQNIANFASSLQMFITPLLGAAKGVLDFISLPVVARIGLYATIVASLNGAFQLLARTGIIQATVAMVKFLATLNIAQLRVYIAGLQTLVAVLRSMITAANIGKIAVVGLKVALGGIIVTAIFTGLDLLAQRLLNIGDAANKSKQGVRELMQELDQIAGSADVEAGTKAYLEANTKLAKARKANEEALADLARAKEAAPDAPSATARFASAQSAADQTYADVLQARREVNAARQSRDTAVRRQEEERNRTQQQLKPIDLSAENGKKTKRERQLRDFESEAIAQLKTNQQIAQEDIDQRRQLDIIDETQFAIESATNKRKFELLMIDEALAQKKADIGQFEAGVREKQLGVFQQLAANERTLVEKQYQTAVKGAKLQLARPFKDAIRDENIEIEKQAQLLENLRNGYSGLTPEQEAAYVIEEKIKELKASQQKIIQTEIDNLKELTLQRILATNAAQRELDLLKLRNQAAQLQAPLGRERLVELMQTPGYTPEQAQAQFALEEQNKRLEVMRQGASDLAGTINSSIGDALTNIVTDFQNLQQHGMTFLQTLANGFKQLANTIIQEMTRAMISKAVSQLFSFIMPSPGNAGGGGGADLTAGIRQYAYANGGIAPGGFRAFASGGVVTGPTLGLVGEGRYNEAVVPLPDGKSIPVQLGGGAGGDISTNIVVNVSNGQASSQMSGNGGQALGRELEGAVRQVILKETRPGGLIYSAR